MNAFALLLVGLAGIIGWLLISNLRAGRERTITRENYFAEAEQLFERVTRRIEPTGFARLTAKHGEHAFDLQAVPDSLSFRKLPALWVLVTLPEPLPVKATLNIMVRATGQEPFSHYASLPQSLPCPSFLPEGSGVRSDNAAMVPPESVIARHASIFNDPRVKELLISPRGLRIVILGDEAERGRYLLFRDAEIGGAPLSPARLTPVLNALLALRQDLIDATKDEV